MTKQNGTVSTPKHHWLFKSATFCGLTPLIFGTLVFLAWAITGKMGLAVTGIYITIFGVVLVTLGTMLLVIYAYLTKTKMCELRLPLISMYINFPIAGIFLAIGFYYYVGFKF